MDPGEESPVQERRELLQTEAQFHRYAAAITFKWFPTWWDKVGFPRGEDGLIHVPADIMLHAGAFSVLGRLEADGYGSLFPPDMPNAWDVLSGFFDRFEISDPNQPVGTQGLELYDLVKGFHLSIVAPMSYDSLEPERFVTVVSTEPEVEGLTCLAEFLMDFRNVLAAATEGPHDDI